MSSDEKKVLGKGQTATKWRKANQNDMQYGNAPSLDCGMHIRTRHKIIYPVKELDRALSNGKQPWVGIYV